MDRSKARRDLLIFHPAGIFFALSALMAGMLPWLWLLPLEDARLAHIRLGIFGFGGLAVSGYLLTAQKAWTGRKVALPALLLGALALAARGAAFFMPELIWPMLVPSLAIALAIMSPVVQARRWDKVALAALPLVLIAAEVLLIDGHIRADMLPLAMAMLILVVGGRAIPAFLAEERHRRGLTPLPLPKFWPGPALLAAGLALEGTAAALALIGVAAWVILQIRAGVWAGPANRMLCLGYAGLLPGLLALAAARMGLTAPFAAVHLLTMGAMGPMILAMAGRVAMRREGAAALLPRRRHWGALWLIFLATAARASAGLAPQPEPWMTLAGTGWSAAWALFLAAHLPALMRPAPFPLFSASRAAPPADAAG